MLLQRKKANSFVPAIFSPWHGLFRKKGGTGAGIRSYFPWKALFWGGPVLGGIFFCCSV